MKFANEMGQPGSNIQKQMFIMIHQNQSTPTQNNFYPKYKKSARDIHSEQQHIGPKCAFKRFQSRRVSPVQLPQGSLLIGQLYNQKRCCQQKHIVSCAQTDHIKSTV